MTIAIQQPLVINQDSGRGRIVIGVDDSREILAPLKAVISAAGYTFFGVASGQECLGLASRAKPHLILLDIQMPEMDGFETCRRLRMIGALERVPVVFLTGRKTVEDVQRGMAAGGNDFMIKPFARDKLLERVRHWSSRTVRPVREPNVPPEPMPAG